MTDEQYVDIGETEWVQRDGTPILYRRMALSHLRNTIAMIKRKEGKMRAWLLTQRMLKGDQREFNNVETAIAENSIRVTIMRAYADERERRNHLLQAPSPRRYAAT